MTIPRNLSGRKLHANYHNLDPEMYPYHLGGAIAKIAHTFNRPNPIPNTVNFLHTFGLRIAEEDNCYTYTEFFHYMANTYNLTQYEVRAAWEFALTAAQNYLDTHLDN